MRRICGVGMKHFKGVVASLLMRRHLEAHLEQGPDIGVASLAIAVGKPSVLFASVWNAHRPPWSSYAPLVGQGSGLYRSEDAGETWQPCEGHGLPEGL